MVKYLIIANVAVYLVQFFIQGGANPTVNWFDRIFAVSPGCFKQFFLWQPFTYMFLHSRFHVMHIMFNMLVLWMLGCELERYWGSKFFLKFYLACGIGAGFLIALTALLGGGITLGASGAIFGLMVAFAMLFPNATILAFFLVPIKARTFVVFLVAIELFSLVAFAGDNVSHLGHLGGALVGYLYITKAWHLRRYIDRLRWKFGKIRIKFKDTDDHHDKDRPYYH
jgi:membrane associated rhomboid family serine protease